MGLEWSASRLARRRRLLAGDAPSPQHLADLGDVLVAPPRQRDEDGGTRSARRRPASRASQASAWAASRAGMMPSVSDSSLKACQHLVVAGLLVAGAADRRTGGRARDRSPGSRARPRSNTPRRSGPPRPAGHRTSSRARRRARPGPPPRHRRPRPPRARHRCRRTQRRSPPRSTRRRCRPPPSRGRRRPAAPGTALGPRRPPPVGARAPSTGTGCGPITDPRQ